MTVRQETDNDTGRSCDMCINAHVMCTWPPGERHACFECTHRHNKCLINGESVTQHVPHGSGLKKKKARIVSQPAIEEVSEEAAVEELTGKEATPEEAIAVVDAPAENTALV